MDFHLRGTTLRVLWLWLSIASIGAGTLGDQSLLPKGKSAWTRSLTPGSCNPADGSGCGVNERCVTSGTTPLSEADELQGQCECDNGYARTPPGWTCVAAGESVAAAESRSSVAPSAAASAAASQLTSVTALPSIVTEVTDRVAYKSSTKSPSANVEGDRVAAPSSSTLYTRTPANISTTQRMPAIRPTQRVVYKLNVSAGEDVTLRYPNDSIVLIADVMPALGLQPELFKYTWTLVQSAADTGSGSMTGLTESRLKLASLLPGFYRAKLVVESDNAYGECFVNITVLPPVRINQPPKAVVKPSEQQITHGNTAVLDGSGSSDDSGIAKYFWEVVRAPVAAASVDYMGSQERPMLQLGKLVPGEYSVRLTVTDTDGVQSSASASLVILKEVDYPPKANAGGDVIISMPQNEVLLMGNSSTDDKGIVSYEWSKLADSPAADITGARTPFLKLSNLQPGDYTFTLKVTDAADQSATDDIHVFVKPDHNRAPVAVVTNASMVVRLTAGAAVTLDGSQSSDDHGITRFEWVQLTGPSTAVLQTSDRGRAIATGLVPGDYQFRLTVYDEEQRKDSAQVKIVAIANVNRPPIAHAGGNLTAALPLSLLVIDGSQSRDEDGHIVHYSWTRRPGSLAAGDVVGSSDKEAVLKLTGVTAGHYVWSLTVTDDEGLSGSDECNIDITPDPTDLDMVELFLEAPIEAFSEASKNSVAAELALLLRRPGTAGETKVIIQHVSQDSLTGLLVISFMVYDGLGEGKPAVRRGAEVAHQLKEKLRRNTDVLDFKVNSVDTLVCQNNCSGHGQCNRYSKKCICDSFWMQNIVRAYMESESNCEWSVIYVGVISTGVMAVHLLAICLCVCACRRRRHMKQHEKRRVYQLVDCLDGDDVKLLTKKHDPTAEDSSGRGATKSHAARGRQSLLLSESELSSDEDTLFVNPSSVNAKWSPAATVDSQEAALKVAGSGGSRA